MNYQRMEHSKNSAQININHSSQSCALGDARRQSQDAGMTKDGMARLLRLRYFTSEWLVRSHVVCQNIFYGTNFVQPFSKKPTLQHPDYCCRHNGAEGQVLCPNIQLQHSICQRYCYYSCKNIAKGTMDSSCLF